MRPIAVARELSLYRGEAHRASQLLQRDLARVQEQLSTGKRINRASDDATGFVQARQLEGLEQRYAAYQETVADSRTWVYQSENALRSVTDLLSEIQTAAVRANSDTLTDEDRAAIATQVEALFASVVDGLNAQAGDEYLFAGHRTDTPPFAADGTPTSAALDGARTRAIGPETTVQINITGAQVQDTGQGFTVTEAVQRLLGALRNDPTAPPLADALGEVTAARDHVAALVGTAGNVAQRLNLAEDQLTAASLEAERRRSEVEDTDYLAALTEAQQKQRSLDAALQTTAQLLQRSLLDYLR